VNLSKDDLKGPGLVELADLAGEATAAWRAAGRSVGGVTASWVGPNYLLCLREELGAQSEGADRFKLLRQAAGDLVSLQHGDVWSARLQLERERLEFQRQKHADRMKLANELAVAAGKLPGADGVRRDPNAPMTDEELKACVDKVDEIMGLK